MGEVITMQDAILKKIGLKVKGSYEEKRFRIEQFCSYQGITVKDLFKILAKEKEPCVIPLRKFGVELEGGIPCSREEFAGILNESGIPAYATGYNHDIVAKWKIGTDSSIRIEGLTPTEITSPQFIGMGERAGFKEIEKLLKIWNEKLNENGTPIGVNRTCGGHVHVDVYDYSVKDLFNLQILVYCLWDLLKFLAPPSRRGNNYYCKKIQPYHFEDNFKVLKGYPEDRYLCLNFNGFSNNLRNVEFRFWPGTTNVKKVKMHVIVSLCLVETAKRKTIWDLLEEVEGDCITIENFLDFIGIKGMHPVLQEVRDYAVERFDHFRGEILSKSVVYQKLREAFKCALSGILTNDFYSDLAKEFLSGEDRKQRINRSYASRIISSLPGIEWENEQVKKIFLPMKNSENTVELTIENCISCSCRKFRRENDCIHKSIAEQILVVLKAFGVTSSQRWNKLQINREINQEETLTSEGEAALAS